MNREQYLSRLKRERLHAHRVQLSVRSSSLPLLKYMRAQRCLAAWSSMDDQNVTRSFGMNLADICRHMSQMGFVWEAAMRLWMVAGNRTAPKLYPSFEEMRDE